MNDFLMGLLSGAFATMVGFLIGVRYERSQTATDNESSHCFSHRWTVWSDPYTPPGYFESYKLQYRKCRDCNKSEARTVS